MRTGLMPVRAKKKAGSRRPVEAGLDPIRFVDDIDGHLLQRWHVLAPVVGTELELA